MSPVNPFLIPQDNRSLQQIGHDAKNEIIDAYEQRKLAAQKKIAELDLGVGEFVKVEWKPYDQYGSNKRSLWGGYVMSNDTKIEIRGEGNQGFLSLSLGSLDDIYRVDAQKQPIEKSTFLLTHNPFLPAGTVISKNPFMP